MNNTWNFLFLCFMKFALHALKPEGMEPKKIFLVSCILCLSFCSFAQGGLAGTLIQGATSMAGSSDYVLSKKMHSAGNYKGNIRVPGDPLYFGVKGTPYFINSFLESDMVLNDGRIYTGVILMYEAYNDAALILSNDDTLMLDKTKVKGFTLKDKIAGKTYCFELTALSPEKTDKHDFNFLEIASSGNIDFLIRHYCELAPANFDPTFNTGSHYDEYSINNSYYIRNSQGEINKIRLNKKSILEILNDKVTEIKKFVSDNKLKYDKEQDAKRIFEFYNSLK